MMLLNAFILIPLAGILLIPLPKERARGIVALTLLFINIILSTFPAVQSLLGQPTDIALAGSLATGPIPLRIDALSGWFMLIINLIFLTGGIYGYFYLNAYRNRRNSLTLHYISLVIQHAALISVCVLQNSFVFLIAWEILALSSFILIIFEHEKQVTIKAGINYLIQAHFSIVFLMIGFIWVINKTGSLDFEAITSYSASVSGPASVILFLFFFAAFAIKAGLVPFHTWLPYAHPAAPSHISGMMSGVIIKIGIYGILRMLLIIKSDLATIGYLILIISVLSGLSQEATCLSQHRKYRYYRDRNRHWLHRDRYRKPGAGGSRLHRGIASYFKPCTFQITVVLCGRECISGGPYHGD
jgi:formate hydrogenlyase subunit 3/multisubunit Na+/H+ antiporter MnhD subunit